MSLHDSLEWVRLLPFAVYVRDSKFLFSFTEAFHLLGFATIFGTVTILNLRFLGLGIRQQSIGEVARQIIPWTAGGLCLSVATGTTLFIVDPLKFAADPAFPLKMCILIVAAIFHFAVLRRLAHTGAAKGGWGKASALLSQVLWFSVALCGRTIGIFS